MDISREVKVFGAYGWKPSLLCAKTVFRNSENLNLVDP
jgi:hypothetical protein